MDTSEFLKKFQQLEYKLVFDQIIELPFARICYCADYDSEYWNYAFVEHVIDNVQLQLIGEEFLKLRRRATIQFVNDPSFAGLVSLLDEHGYVKKYEDSWMFFEGNEIVQSRFSEVKKVETVEELKIFLRVFDASYQADDPQNPYGELGGYLVTAERDWMNHHESGRVEYFIVFKEQEPVAVSTIIHHEDIGYIANVGSLRDVRGQGYGKLATLYCVNVSQKKGNKYHCLSTEEGTFPYEFYQKIGFKKKFSTLGFTKQVI
jgi:ribosomal protein S18 acetylase RimI-like enzyme